VCRRRKLRCHDLRGHHERSVWNLQNIQFHIFVRFRCCDGQWKPATGSGGLWLSCREHCMGRRWLEEGDQLGLVVLSRAGFRRSCLPFYYCISTSNFMCSFQHRTGMCSTPTSDVFTTTFDLESRLFGPSLRLSLIEALIYSSTDHHVVRWYSLIYTTRLRHLPSRYFFRTVSPLRATYFNYNFCRRTVPPLEWHLEHTFRHTSCSILTLWIGS
jgi:hypothetical protein